MNHPALGEVIVRRTPKARRVSISVRPPQGEVRLTLPMRGSLKDALRFLDQKIEWIATARRRVRDRAAQWQANSAAGMADPTDGFAGSTGDAGTAASARRTAADIEILRKQAKQVLPARLDELARYCGFNHGQVSVRNTVSKWGSCSALGDISLSLHLMRLPAHLIDYVILHELCHTVHHNHGAEFHALLNHVTNGRHPALRRELRNYNPKY